jgi:hypothetical protein
VLVFWPHSVFGQNHLCVKICKQGFHYSESASQKNSSSLSAVRTIEPSRPDAHLSTIPSGRRVYRSDLQDRSTSSIRTKCSSCSEPILYREISVPACIRPDVSAACPDASQYSISFWFLSKLQEREDQSTVRTMWYPVRTCVSLRQESQFRYDIPDVWRLWSDARASKKEIADLTSIVRTTAYHCLDARNADMEIAWWRITIQTLITHGPDAREPYKEITCSGRATVRTMYHPIRTRPLNKKDFPVKFLKKLVAQLSVRTAHVHRPDGA